jgi:hypothetical protein
MDKEKEQETALSPALQCGSNESSKAAEFIPAGRSTTPEGVVEVTPDSTPEDKDQEREDISLSETADKTVPMSELRKVYKEMKKWKEKYRALKTLEPLLAQQEAQIEELRSLISETRVDKAILESAKEHGAIEPEQVAQFLRSSIRLGDDLLAYAVDSEGKQRYSAENKAFTIDDLVKEFLIKHPHHKKASMAGGSGSSHSPVSISATLVARIKNAQSQKELEKIVCPKTT